MERMQQGGARSLSASGSATFEDSGQPRVWNNGQSTKGGAIEASEAAMWHRLRRKAIIEAHPEAKELEGRDWRGGALLLFSNMLQLAVSLSHRPCSGKTLHCVILVVVVVVVVVLVVVVVDFHITSPRCTLSTSHAPFPMFSDRRRLRQA